MKNLILVLLILTASTGLAQTQKPAGSDNRTYALAEVDEKPELEGTVSFSAFFTKHFKSPVKLTAPVKMVFTIEKNGLALNPRLPEGTDLAVVKEAKRVLKAAPKWKPGKRSGNAVRTTYDFTIPKSK